MSPLLPPLGAEVETVLEPYPFDPIAIDNVLFALKSPPPVNPPVPVIVVPSDAAPKLLLAAPAVLAPVPPALTANGVMPVIEPPVMATDPAF